MDAAPCRRTDINTLPSNGFRLFTLGALRLVDAQGETDESLAKRRRKLALLAVLALDGRPISRERLAGMFWGDEDETRARHSLSDALSSLRRVLGPESITTRQFDVALSSKCSLAVDALELLEAAGGRDHARVLALYQGEFLQSVDVPESAGYEQWANRIRGELHRHWVTACGVHCLGLARSRKWEECAMLARKWLDAEPTSSDAALYVLNALKAPATREAYQAAQREFTLLARRLLQEFDRSPAPEVVQLAASIREQVPPLPAPSDPAPVVGDGSRRPPASPAPRLGMTRVRLKTIPLAASLFLATTSFTSHAGRPQAVESRRPSVAIVEIRNISGARSTAWLELGLAKMIAADIGALSSLDIVAAERVREAREALDLRSALPLRRTDIVRVGVRSGASWVATGGILRGDSLYTLDLTVQDLVRGTPPRSFTLTSTSLVALADQAAARLTRLTTREDPPRVYAGVDAAFRASEMSRK